jgi:uncharacterized membrane protein (UPF0127 family)
MPTTQTSTDNSTQVLRNLISQVLTFGIAGFVAIVLIVFFVITGVANKENVFSNVDPGNSRSQINSSLTSKQVTILTNGHGDQYSLKVADTPEKRATGLMNITSLKDDEGMIFVFEEPQQVSFWMKDTYIPLDMIFVDEDMQIVKVVVNATPLKEDAYNSPKKVKYVLELRGGISAEKGYTISDKIKLAE